jgi:hypothetical protein
MPIRMKNIIKGKRTKNHANCLYPVQQMELRTNVQKAIYRNFTKKTKNVLGTVHSKLPTQ